MGLTELQSKSWEVLRAAKIGSEIKSNQVKDIIGLHTRKSGDFRSIIHALRVKGYPSFSLMLRSPVLCPWDFKIPERKATP